LWLKLQLNAQRIKQGEATTTSTKAPSALATDEVCCRLSPVFREPNYAAKMLEYFTYKKYKKWKAEKEAKLKLEKDKGKDKVTTSTAPKQVLSDADEQFLERLTARPEAVSDGEGPKPPLPPRVPTPELSWDSDSESFRKPKEDNKPDGKATDKKANRLSLLLRRGDKKTPKEGLASNQLTVPDPEVDREKDDLTRVLDDLNLSAKNNKAFSLSAESNELVVKFTLVLKDLVNGVPTAVNDLTTLLDDRNGVLAKNFDKLPKSMKKLVTQIPDKLSTSLAPELLAVAAEVQGLTKEDAAAKGGLKGAAKRLLMPKNLAELVTKPGAIVGMLKGIMNALKLRWPAFIGTNVIWSVAIFRK
jgi:hypothetical protein